MTELFIRFENGASNYSEAGKEIQSLFSRLSSDFIEKMEKLYGPLDCRALELIMMDAVQEASMMNLMARQNSTKTV